MCYRSGVCVVFVLMALIVYSCNEEYSDSDTIDFNIEEYLQHVNEGSEFIIVIPDIQNYISYQTNVKYLEKIINWIIQFDKAGFKIKAVLQVGDVTNFNTRQEWERAQTLFSKLDNNIDYMLCTGNHDYGDDGTCNNRSSFFSEYFNFKDNTSFICSYEKNTFENSFFKFNIHGLPFQLISLEFGPRNSVVEWADSIVKVNSNARGIVMTHAFLFRDKERLDFKNKSDIQYGSPHEYGNHFPIFGNESVNDGEELWTKLINEKTNLRFVLSGHKTIPNIYGTLISKNQAEKDVLQSFFNTQDFPNGGNGWIQIFEFLNDKETVRVKAFSPVAKKWESDLINNQYDFNYR